MNRVIILVLALGISSSLYAQVPSPTTPGPGPTIAPSVSPTPNPEVIALRAQLEIMRQYDGRILSTVYWSLGVIATLVLLLAGYGWYTNYRVYERDKTAMQQDLQGYLQQETAKFSKSMSEANDRFRADMLTDITQRIENARTAALEASKSATEPIVEQLLFVKYDLRRVEAWYWETRQVFYAAFVTHMQGLEELNSLARKFPDLAGANYEVVLRDFERNLANDFEIDEKFYLRAEKALAGVPAQHAEQVNRVRELMKKKTTSASLGQASPP